MLGMLVVKGMIHDPVVYGARLVYCVSGTLGSTFCAITGMVLKEGWTTCPTGKKVVSELVCICDYGETLRKRTSNSTMW